MIVNKDMKITLIILALLLLLATGCGSGFGSPEPSPTPTVEEPTPEPSPKPTPKPTPEPDDEIVLEETVETLVAIIEAGIEYDFEENFNVEYDADHNTVVVSLWFDTLAYLLMDAADGDESAIEFWNDLVDGFEKLNKGHMMIAEHLHLDDVGIITLIVNDVNKERYLLKIYNGKVGYNILIEDSCDCPDCQDD